MLCLLQECEDAEGFELYVGCMASVFMLIAVGCVYRFTPDLCEFAKQLQPHLHARQAEAARAVLGKRAITRIVVEAFSVNFLEPAANGIPILIQILIKVFHLFGKSKKISGRNPPLC